MKTRFIFILSAILLVLTSAGCDRGGTTRQERRLINKGNELYKSKKYQEAAKAYEEALQVNANSDEARYNLGLAQIRQVSNPADTTAATKAMVEKAMANFTTVSARAKEKPGLAAKANYNMGNMEFNAKQFDKAIGYYKQSLRIDADDDRTRMNLRIAQLNLKKDQNKDNQDQNKNQDQDKKDQQQDQNKDQNKDQQNQSQQQDQQNQQQKQQKEMSQQAASQILQAIDNKESATRARVNKARKGEKSAAAGRNNRRW